MIMCGCACCITDLCSHVAINGYPFNATDIDVDCMLVCFGTRPWQSIARGRRWHAAVQRNRVDFAARWIRCAWAAATRRQWCDAITLPHPLARRVAERNANAARITEFLFVDEGAPSFWVCERVVVSSHVFHAHRAHAFDISAIRLRMKSTAGIECRKTARPCRCLR